jgi:predicted HNH restriction endonuclease
VFANVGISGRTGHDYNNYWHGDFFYWQGAAGSNVNQPSIRELLSNEFTVHIFTRTEDKSPFYYEGEGTIHESEDTVPVNVIWKFTSSKEMRNERLPEEITQPVNLWEGSVREIKVNIYERNTLARRICINHFGCTCQICGFNFEEIYGEIGRNFIHVHHITPIHQISKNYIIDPLTDLIPVCPNCHSILHRYNPPITIEKLKTTIKKYRTV